MCSQHPGFPLARIMVYLPPRLCIVGTSPLTAQLLRSTGENFRMSSDSYIAFPSPDPVHEKKKVCYLMS